MTVPIAETVFGALLYADLQKAIEKEFEMALQDRVMEETKDKKNAVESHVYDMRNKVYDELTSCMSYLANLTHWLTFCVFVFS